MILRFGALVVILYALGFFLFSITLGVAAESAGKTDAIIAITGGAGRIERGVELLADGEGKRMLVAGADPSVTKKDLIRRLGGKRKLVNCCIDLGSESVDTRSNAEEAKRWLDRSGYRSLRLITSDWHMRRAAYEFHRVLGEDYRIVEDAVASEPRFVTLFGEYNKYILRRLAVWLEI